LKLSDLILSGIFGFVAGAYLPATLGFIFLYIRKAWKSRIRSFWFFVRLLWGVVWRIVGSFAMVIAIAAVIDALGGFQRHDATGYAVTGLSMLAGFFGSIALFIFGYVLGRVQRRRESVV